MADDAISTELLQTTMRSLRQEIGEVRRLVLSQGDAMRRLERNQTELKDDLEMMLKMEIMGFRAALETSFDARFAELQAVLERRR